MAQEDQAHDGHEVFVRRQIGIRPQIVGNLPEVGFEFLNALEVVGCHAARFLPSRLERWLGCRGYPHIHIRVPSFASSSATIASRWTGAYPGVGTHEGANGRES